MNSDKIFEDINRAIKAITPGTYDVIITEKEKDPSWQLPSPENRKRKRPKIEWVIGGLGGEDHIILLEEGRHLQYLG